MLHLHDAGSVHVASHIDGFVPMSGSALGNHAAGTYINSMIMLMLHAA